MSIAMRESTLKSSTFLRELLERKKKSKGRSVAKDYYHDRSYSFWRDCREVVGADRTTRSVGGPADGMVAGTKIGGTDVVKRVA